MTATIRSMSDPAPRVDFGTVPTKRIWINAQEYVTVPVAIRANGVSRDDWERLSRINDQILDRISYDERRGKQPKTQGVQAPSVTWQRRTGVCSDIAALFEHLARQAGYQAISIQSDVINHAWNQVTIDGREYIVDVTWNGGNSFTDGKTIPENVRRDPDYRKRYFMIRPDQEDRLYRDHILGHNHHVSDARPIDYEKTLDAMAIISQIDPLVDQRNALVRLEHQMVESRNKDADQYNQTVASFNSSRAQRARTAYKQRLEGLSAKIDDTDRSLAQLQSKIDTIGAKCDTLYASFRAIAASHPIGVSYHLGRTSGTG